MGYIKCETCTKKCCYLVTNQTKFSLTYKVPNDQFEKYVK